MAAFDDICRLCLQHNPNMLEIFREMVIIGSRTKFYQKIKYLTDTPIFEGDGLSSKICTNCAKNVTRFYKFREKCQSNFGIMQAFILNPGISTFEEHHKSFYDADDHEMGESSYLQNDMESIIEEKAELLPEVINPEWLDPEVTIYETAAEAEFVQQYIHIDSIKIENEPEIEVEYESSTPVIAHANINYCTEFHNQDDTYKSSNNSYSVEGTNHMPLKDLSYTNNSNHEINPCNVKVNNHCPSLTTTPIAKSPIRRRTPKENVITSTINVISRQMSPCMSPYVSPNKLNIMQFHRNMKTCEVILKDVLKEKQHAIGKLLDNEKHRLHINKNYKTKVHDKLFPKKNLKLMKKNILKSA